MCDRDRHYIIVRTQRSYLWKQLEPLSNIKCLRIRSLIKTVDNLNLQKPSNVGVKSLTNYVPLKKNALRFAIRIICIGLRLEYFSYE